MFEKVVSCSPGHHVLKWRRARYRGRISCSSKHRGHQYCIHARQSKRLLIPLHLKYTMCVNPEIHTGHPQNPFIILVQEHILIKWTHNHKEMSTAAGNISRFPVLLSMNESALLLISRFLGWCTLSTLSVSYGIYSYHESFHEINVACRKQNHCSQCFSSMGLHHSAAEFLSCVGIIDHRNLDITWIWRPTTNTSTIINPQTLRTRQAHPAGCALVVKVAAAHRLEPLLLGCPHKCSWEWWRHH